MLTKKFKVVKISIEPLYGDIYGYVLLGRDAEAWHVSRSVGGCSQWKLGDVIELPLRYLGNDLIRPDFEQVDAFCWEEINAERKYVAVTNFWGQDIADRFVTDDDDCPRLRS